MTDTGVIVRRYSDRKRRWRKTSLKSSRRGCVLAARLSRCRKLRPCISCTLLVSQSLRSYSLSVVELELEILLCLSPRQDCHRVLVQKANPRPADLARTQFAVHRELVVPCPTKSDAGTPSTCIGAALRLGRDRRRHLRLLFFSPDFDSLSRNRAAPACAVQALQVNHATVPALAQSTRTSPPDLEPPLVARRKDCLLALGQRRGRSCRR